MIDGTLFGFPQWVRVPWLNCIYFPFWRSINAVRRAWSAAFDDGVVLVTVEELIDLTTPLEEHPEGYDGPCNCALCRSCA